MKELIIDLGVKHNSIQIVPLGDLHVGDEFCDLNLIKNTIEYIAKNDNCYCILNGDLINNGLKTSKSDSYREKLTIEEEQDNLIELLMPIKDKILIMTQGNHEYRTSLLAGIDPLRYVAKSLGLIEKDRYTDNSYILTLLFGKRNGNKDRTNNYVIYGIHGGSGGGRRAGATSNALEDMNKVIANADLYLHSHTHTVMHFSDAVLLYNINTKKLEKHTRTYYNTNSFVSYGGYAETKGYKMTDTTPSVLVISMVRTKDKMRKITNLCKI